MNDNALILTLGHREVMAQSAIATMFVATEKYVEKRFGPIKRGGAWEYGAEHANCWIELEVAVDRDSGEDGAAAPMARLDFPPSAWNYPSLADLAGEQFTEAGPVQIEAFYGNDAPDIRNNAVSFAKDTRPDHLMIEWTGEYVFGRGAPVEQFKLSGPVKFSHFEIHLKSDGDLDAIMAAAMPGFDLSDLKVPEISDQIYQPPMPENRRHWRIHRYAFD